MSDNDILVARKTAEGHKAVVIDGDKVDFERQNKAVKSRKEAERKAEEARCSEAERERIRKEQEKEKMFWANQIRKRRIIRSVELGVSTCAMVGLVAFELMHPIVGMVFTAVISAVIGSYMQ